MVHVVLLVILVVIVTLPPLVFFGYMYALSKKPKHSIIRSHPFLGWLRYLLEKLGPEFRQYWFDNDTEGKPFSRADFVGVVYAAKYRTDLISFGGRRDYEKPGFYLSNAMFPKLTSELRVDNEGVIPGKKYIITNEGLFTRKEKFIDEQVKPWLLHDEDVIIVGENRKHPWRLKGMFGASATSFGAVGEHYIQSTGSGAFVANGSWINTGEGGVADVHLATGVDVISQIGPGMFGFRDDRGRFSIEEYKHKAKVSNIKAFELKFHQGAKIRGGHLEGTKVTEKVAKARLVPVGKTVNSPNRFEFLTNPEEALRFISTLQEEGGKPVGVKIVVGDPKRLEPFFQAMLVLDIYPDFITVDGSEGGSGATFKAMADGMGLPLFSALLILDDTARKFGVRDRFKIFASGKLITPDKVAIALALGADCVNSARGFMMANGCIMAMQCHTGKCPTGITTTDFKYQEALAPEEKQWRVMNYILQLREGLFSLAAACGLDSPRGFRREHVVFTNESGHSVRIVELFPYPEESISSVT
ncbi:Glutamate synthase domain-containing protein 2 [Paenibacillus sp. yr247]|uniref:FMN-binding glutamate synthase family protein n=1 Tax=Paenibacillus sp. yr247 TaxID=1761880 RepID=UPI000882A427|nr:FMN-binding glutamate synthase family protein [Paenibacillus sp. yr247]SDO78047.1 Glutamate synthase domain-containing protein 2 [Paenibacillus sp. yr247]